MSDHLSECWAVMCECEDAHFYSQTCGYGCICPSLYACEQRVLNLNPVALGVLIAQRARERALNAAREAVEAVPHWIEMAVALPWSVRGEKWIAKDLALNAIDALREERSDD